MKHVNSHSTKVNRAWMQEIGVIESFNFQLYLSNNTNLLH